MNVYLNSIVGIPDAIVSMFMSKRSWSREFEEHVRQICQKCLDENGFPSSIYNSSDIDRKKFFDWFSKLIKWGSKHPTMLRFIDISVTVEGIHRGAQDDFDSHAKRLDNRIIRSSTRLANFTNEMSDWYKNKIFTTDSILDALQIEVPKETFVDNVKYIKTTNGYIREDLKDNKDVKRGLYMESIPSDFIFKCNLTEYAHIIKERDINSNAAPELQEMIENSLSQIESKFKQINREFFYSIIQ